MKISSFAFPILAQAADDTSTLLSLKVHTALESGVDHLLDAVGSRNVTQMSALLQNLVEETIQDPAYHQLDPDVTAALDLIKRTLLMDIRGALNEAHCYDQSELHTQIKCFERCEHRFTEGDESCGFRCDGKEHKKCRDSLLVKYTEHISKCRALDDFVWGFTKNDCPEFQKKCCLLSHTTWNCGGLCAGTIAKMDVDASLGFWINKQIGVFQAAYDQWLKLHKECTASYHSYVELDAECDCKQADCEARNCQWDQCKYINCEMRYNECWGDCEAEWERTSKAKECLEKDRKIDWSATEKIECYVNVLLEKPTPEELLATCGKEDCFNEYREQMYHKCNTICVEVDFENGSGKLEEHVRRSHEDAAYTGKLTDVKDQATGQYQDQDVTEEGEHSVRTRHRSHNKEEENRCTSHLDLDYQLPPCCHPCEPRPSAPCEETKPLPEPESLCPTGLDAGDMAAVRSGDGSSKCYFVNRHVGDINAGRDWCESHGGELASVHSSDDNQAIMDIQGGASMYIGALGKECPNMHTLCTWTWEDGSAWNDPNAMGIANDGLNHNNFRTHETRIALHSDRRWHDWIHGESIKGVVCQRKASPPPAGHMDKSSYMWLFYGQYGFLDDVAIDYMTQQVCHAGEHTYLYGYNLCDCIDCPKLPPCGKEHCTHAKACSYPATYDYSQHDIKVDCSAISDSEVGPYTTGDIAVDE